MPPRAGRRKLGGPVDDLPSPMAPPAGALLPPALGRRLRAVWRSAGWPCRDPLEAELLARGLLASRHDASGRETLSVTPAGVAAMAAATARHRRARGPHEALVDRVARHLQREGRIVWRGLSLRAGLEAPAAEALQGSALPAGRAHPALDLGFPGPAHPEPLHDLAAGSRDAGGGGGAGGHTHGRSEAGRLRWVMAQPDLFSLRPSTVEDGLLPMAHEIKAHRSDLLADLRRPDKARAYRALAGACWYVLREGIGDDDDVPPPFGVMRERGEALEVLRPPERHPVRLGLATWLALARAVPEGPPEDPEQAALAPP